MQTIAQWLAEIGMGSYVPLFEAQRIELDVVACLTDQDLQEIGVTALGDRKRILSAIAKAQREIPASARLSQQSAASLPAKAQAAERRQLTVMFCDLVGSTELACMLDPEDLRGVISAYHDAATAAVAAHNGYVARLIGDGVLVYFGYPHANEDDARSAIQAAIDVIAAVNRLAIGGLRTLHTRIGIATGLVVVGEIGAGTSAAEFSVSGETPNLAARLQNQAAPDCIVIADQTRRVIGDAFELESLGLLTFKGFEAPVQAWQVLRKRRAASRFETIHMEQLSRFIGRDSELSLLLERWYTACEGEGQTVLLSGEPGIGKSRITLTLRERTAALAAETVLLQCSPSHSNSALYPVVHYLELVAALAPAGTPAERAQRFEGYLTDLALAPDALGYLLRLMTLPDGSRPAPANQTPQQEKASTLQAVIDLIVGLSWRAPVLVLIEDAHWIDPTTEEWLGLVVDQLRDARVLMLITCRPEYRPTWGNPVNLTRLTMNRLTRRQSAALVDSVTAGKPLPAEVIDEIIRKTDGVPLFVEELAKTVLASTIVEETPDGYRLRGPLQALAIPSTLQDSLMARLDRLETAKEIAQVAAAIGRDFSYRLLALVLQTSATRLEHALDELLRAELVFRRDGPPDVTYSFKHALIRDTAYGSMLKTQRALWHAQIARTLEHSEPKMVGIHPELLAQHHQEAGHDSEAVRCWMAAGDLAVHRSANREAVVHYDAAIALVVRLQADPARSELELVLRLKLGNALSVTEGYGAQSTYQSFARACELARELGRAEDFVSAWAGSSPTMFNAGRGAELIESINELEPEQLSSLAPSFHVLVSLVVGVAHLLRSEIDQAWASIESGIILDDGATAANGIRVAGIDPAVLMRSYGVRIRAMQGYLEQAESLANETLQIAESSGHAPTIGVARLGRIMVLLWKGEFAQAASEAKQSLALSERLGFNVRIATSSICLGRASTALGDSDAGTVLLRKGYDLWVSVGGITHRSEYGAQAAEALLRAGRIDEARRYIDDAQAFQSESDVRFCEADLLRLSGRCREINGDIDGAQARFRDAIRIADKCGLKLFSLRAACDLARLWQRHQRADDVSQMLEPIYGWFKEGFHFTDLREARALLDSLQDDRLASSTDIAVAPLIRA